MITRVLLGLLLIGLMSVCVAGVVSAHLLTAYEEDKVTLEIEAEDPDGDLLAINYTSPFNAEGEWQTKLNDAGNYSTQVIIRDSRGAETIENITVVIARKNIPPPAIKGTYSVKEGELFELTLASENRRGTPIKYSAELPEGAQLVNNTITWMPTLDTVKAEPSWFVRTLHKWQLLDSFSLDDRKEFPVRVVGVSENATTEGTLFINVINTNRAPFFEFLPTALSAVEGDILPINYQVNDSDRDYLFVFFSGLVERNNQLLGYDTAGVHNQSVTLSDGALKETRIIAVSVANTNRAPLPPSLSALSVAESDKKIFALDAQDPDGDAVSYSLVGAPSFVTLENNSLILAPSFDIVVHNESQQFSAKILASDGNLSTEHSVRIDIKNVNRKPKILATNPSERFIAKKGQVLSFSVNVTDVDGDALTYTWTGSMFSAQKGDATHGRRFLRSGVRTLSVEVSDGKESVEYEWKILVK